MILMEGQRAKSLDTIDLAAPFGDHELCTREKPCWEWDEMPAVLHITFTNDTELRFLRSSLAQTG